MNLSRRAFLIVVLAFATSASAFTINLINLDLEDTLNNAAAIILALEEGTGDVADSSVLGTEIPADADLSGFASESLMPMTMASPTPGFVVSPHDKVPDFCMAATRKSVKSGAWSDPATWGGSVPIAGSQVSIQAGHTVTYDVNSSNSIDCIGVHGTLTFDSNTSTKLVVANFLVHPEGSLLVGTVAKPITSNVTAEIIIAGKALNLTTDPGQFGTGLIGFGKVHINGSPLNNTFIRLAQAPVAGATSLVLSEAPTGWKVGDTVMIPRSLNSDKVVTKGEESVIAAISGNTITLRTPLGYPHPGAVDANGQIRFLPHVANMTRNVIIRSQNPTGVRGHVWLTDRANVDIRYAAFIELGRTRGDIAVKGSTNHVGRYPLHIHHLIGSATAPSNGYQFTLQGNVVERNPEVNPYSAKWAIVIHASHYGLIKDNVTYRSTNAGIATEDGSETGNVFDHNFVVWNTGPGAHYDFLAGFTLRGPNNTVKNNVSVDASWGYKILFGFPGLSKVNIPKGPGLDTMVAGNITTMDIRSVPWGQFSNNEAYANSQGINITDVVGNTTNTLPSMPERLISGMKLWNNSTGAMIWGVANLTFDNFVGIGNSTAIQQQPGGNRGHNRPIKNITVKNADIQGSGTGINLSSQFGTKADLSGGTFTLENSYLKNVVDVMIGHEGGFDHVFIPSKYVFKDVKFETIPAASNARNKRQATIFAGNHATNWLGTNYISKSEIYVYNYNKIAGNDFRVYATEQHPETIVPLSIPYVNQNTKFIVASPVANETNVQNWVARNLAIDGEVATCSNLSTHPEIKGYTCPIAASFNPSTYTAAFKVAFDVSPTYQAVGKPIVFLATPSDPSKVSKVEFYTENTVSNTPILIGSDTVSPYSVTKSFSGASYRAYARIYTKDGQIINSSEINFTSKGTIVAASTLTSTTPTPAITATATSTTPSISTQTSTTTISTTSTTPPADLISLEAESYTNSVARGGKAWEKVSTGTSIQALPNTGTALTSNAETTSPQVDYSVNFAEGGKKYIWIKGIGASGTDDSLHVGVDGNVQSYSLSIGVTGFTTRLSWKRAEITVSSAGQHTVSLWMREDGMLVDKIQITSNSSYVPK